MRSFAKIVFAICRAQVFDIIRGERNEKDMLMVKNDSVWMRTAANMSQTLDVWRNANGR